MNSPRYTITVVHDLIRPFRIGRLPFLQPHSAVVSTTAEDLVPGQGAGGHARRHPAPAAPQIHGYKYTEQRDDRENQTYQQDYIFVYLCALLTYPFFFQFFSFCSLKSGCVFLLQCTAPCLTHIIVCLLACL